MRLRFKGTHMRTLLIAGLMLGALSTAFAADTETNKPSMLDLRLEAGKVRGRVDDRPLAEVLERLSQLQSFTYSGAPVLLEHRISKVFAELSLSGALRHALAGFDYYLVTDASGDVVQLTITNVSGEARPKPLKPGVGEPGGPKPLAASETSPPPEETQAPLVTAAPGIALSEEERAAFEAGMQEGMTPELYESFHPETPPEMVQSGPPPPPGMEGLTPPQSDEETSLTGPSPPDR